MHALKWSCMRVACTWGNGKKWAKDGCDGGMIEKWVEDKLKVVWYGDGFGGWQG